jgi:toxin YoeB
MKLVWSENAWDDYLHWQKSDQKIVEWINNLIKDIKHDPFKGLGKPEPLKHALQGWWSRRITQEDRLVYRISGTESNKYLEIIQCRYHY